MSTIPNDPDGQQNPQSYPYGQPGPTGYSQQPDVQQPQAFAPPPFPQTQAYTAQPYADQPYAAQQPYSPAPGYGAQPAPYGYGQPNPYATPVAPKSPALMLLASFFVPGLGTMINGETSKGVGILVGYIACWVLFWLIVPILVALGLWVWGMVDAYQGAQNWNRAHGVWAS